tara:strand:- start:280 stop:708 length:429 start_codon:yes stop_codon:yes gene_type:complete
MIISCSSCNAKYLVNSAELKPSGRTVQCAKCSYQWFQSATIAEEEPFIFSSADSSIQEDTEEKVSKDVIQNLPSTYVQEQKPSFINSIFAIFIVILLIASFLYYKNYGINFYIVINYYIQEFYFNLKLIINDLAKLFYQIIN